MVPLLNTETRWECPNCPATHLTTVAEPHQPFHQCPGLHGMLAPYVAAGTGCKVEAVSAATTWPASVACGSTAKAVLSCP